MSTAVTPPTVHPARGGRESQGVMRDHDTQSKLLLVSYGQGPLELS